MPSSGDPVNRDEGVGIVLNQLATKHRKIEVSNGEQFSSRVVTACLKLKSGKILTIISVYALTFHSPLCVKDEFYIDLQECIDQIPDSLLINCFR